MNSEVNINLALSPVTPVKTETGPQNNTAKSSTVNANQDTNQDKQNSQVLSLDAVKKAAYQSNQLLQNINLSVEFAVDSSTKEVVIKVVDSGTGKLVRQIPSAEMLDFVKRLQDLESKKQGAVIQSRA